MMKKLSLAYLHVLNGVYTLKLEGIEATADGLSKILRGVVDLDTNKFIYSAAFKALPSLSSRRLKGRINTLITKGYLEEDYDFETKTSFLRLTKMCDELRLEPLEKKDIELTINTNVRLIKEDKQ